MKRRMKSMYDVQGEGLTGERKGFVSDIDSSIMMEGVIKPGNEGSAA
jgi:hypothetical protein